MFNEFLFEGIAENIDVYDILKVVLNSLHEAVVIVDNDSKIVYANLAYSRVIGVPLEKVYMKKISKIEPHANILNVIRTGEPIISGITVVSSVNVRVMYDALPIRTEGKVVGVIAVFREVEDVLKLTEELQKTILIKEHLEDELSKHHGLPNGFKDIISNTGIMNDVLKKAAKVAPMETTILMRGESGTGKGVIARAIHMESMRKNGPFLSINCAAIPEGLLESELFGYEKGAFTNASSNGKPGMFELAKGGTIFLDEIGDMPYTMQAKILRVLQEKEFTRIGGTKTIKADTRVIAATNCNLEQHVQEGKFREDLFYRINVISLNLPPLKSRKSDLNPLIDRLVSKFSRHSGKKTLSREVIYTLHQYDWPGNIRELENVIEHAVIMADGEVVEKKHLPEYLLNRKPQTDEFESLVIRFQEEKNLSEYVSFVEKEVLKNTLKNHHNKTEAMKKLGINRRTFYQKLKIYDLM